MTTVVAEWLGSCVWNRMWWFKSYLRFCLFPLNFCLSFCTISVQNEIMGKEYDKTELQGSIWIDYYEMSTFCYENLSCSIHFIIILSYTPTRLATLHSTYMYLQWSLCEHMYTYKIHQVSRTSDNCGVHRSSPQITARTVLISYLDNSITLEGRLQQLWQRK